jgi:capsular exopolysaccharide synthesis family protein
VDLRELLSILWKRRLIVFLVVVQSAIFGIVFGETREPTYESTDTVAITPRVGLIPSDQLSTLLGTYAQTAESDVVRDAAAAKLGHPVTGTVSAATEAGTGILLISARSSSPDSARETANAVTKAFLAHIQGAKFVTAEVVNTAVTPSTPVQPRMPLIIGASIVLGLGAAVLVALVLERFRARIETAADVGEVTQLPVLAEIPRSRGLRRADPQAVWEDSRRVEAQEAFRTLRTNLQFVTGRSGGAIQITSPSDSEGTSMIVANLGIAFAQVGVDTVIVDADLRRPAQHEVFGVESRSTVWGQGSPSLDSMETWTQSTQYPGLSVVPAGEELGNPTELLHIRFAPIIGELKEAYDLVLVDSPPLLPVSDGIITAAWVDAVVFVVSAGQERTSNLKRAIDSLKLTDATIAGIVLNQTAVRMGDYSHWRGGTRPPSESVPTSEPIGAISRKPPSKPASESVPSKPIGALSRKPPSKPRWSRSRRRRRAGAQ